MLLCLTTMIIILLSFLTLELMHVYKHPKKAIEVLRPINSVIAILLHYHAGTGVC